MTSISQAQAGFKANSRRNPLWISRLFNAKASCACRNRLNFRLFRYTLACCSNAAPIRASSSAGQSWRLITAWSRVQVLPGPYEKKTPIRVSFFRISGRAGLEQGGSDNAVGRVSNQPSRLLLSPRVPTTRNVYQESTITHPGVFFRIFGSFIPHPLRAAGSTGGSRRPAFPAAGRGCPAPRCPPRPAQGCGRSP